MDDWHVVSRVFRVAARVLWITGVLLLGGSEWLLRCCG